MPVRNDAEVAVIGAGIVGLAVAFYLAQHHGITRVAVVDPGDPMAMTSAQSGENYRNWWPHPVMTAFTDHAIDLLEAIAQDSGNQVRMTRRGYALATRHARPDELLAELHGGYGDDAARRIRVHENGARGYRPATDPGWDAAPDGVDVLLGRAAVAAGFPDLAEDVQTVVHIRRAGDLSGQQLGQLMLDRMRPAGVRLCRAAVTGIERDRDFILHLRDADGPSVLRAERIVNAAGPFLGPVAAMLGESLPVRCVFQQKIAFDDRLGALPRTMPFTIDLDPQELDWTEEERAILASEPEGARLLQPMRGGVHRRPEGGDAGRWIKLGWAYNDVPSGPDDPVPLDPNFPDIVLRAAGRLNPGLRRYLGNLPRGMRHYGGFYTMTDENWPLIGPMETPGAFVAGALSGFGTMAATATGALCAAWVAGAPRPSYAAHLSSARHGDAGLMAALRGGASRGVL